MADEQPAPGPPQGFQRPGVPGAGNLLDPEVRGELREQVQAAMPHPPGHAAPPAPAAQPAPPTAAPDATLGATTATPTSTPTAVQHRAGPYPHGDMDLSDFAPNVPPGPVRPQRGRTRSYYFLKQAATSAEEPTAPSIQPPPGPRPG